MNYSQFNALTFGTNAISQPTITDREIEPNLNDIVTGFLLAGVGQKDKKKSENFLVVDNKTSIQKIEQAFKTYTSRPDIAIILISQKIADEIRPLIDGYNQVIPTILEIPSKDHPYDPTKDSVMMKVKRMTGSE
ncbi:vacuolar H+ ATPase F subunit [Cavenderia fasciculata]|uniref:Vacuolar H+ ATPase F subunit n=1 Tax=Cavenderia fasciculata TaxID=261658 RepID=F4PK14_CACFS|nr:vacuolar H+ ATPase F subunit [Cavenderia fasciculata]EGG23938.1 vacuolar H+ ATPase F subunit [Cavenderia fasciculata]|eukprot:XP_004361789.1 vacuolar H+ ATPase F subunit [Cavenderia fasciculata]